jgi:hypothetical protein
MGTVRMPPSVFTTNAFFFQDLGMEFLHLPGIGLDGSDESLSFLR